MQTRTFNVDDQLVFARLSGDYNELHLDETAARRSLFGAPVVHGINALLWALDVCLSEREQPCRLVHLKALFTHQIKLGEEVHLDRIKLDDKTLRARIMLGDQAAVTIKATLAEQDTAARTITREGLPNAEKPTDLPGTEIATARGELELILDQNLVRSLYPAVARVIDPVQTAVILASTRLVGMRCPGRYSLYSELELAASNDDNPDGLHYQVDSVDERFGLIEMSLSAPGVKGIIRAFRRPAPRCQASLDSLRMNVEPQEFAGQRALVIGGSRGLGEVVAKLLVAGGADVRFTFYSGEQDAASLLHELQSGGGIAGYFRCNVLDPNPLASIDIPNDWRPTHLYFFATPFIEPGIPGQFSNSLFKRFCEFYVGGFARCVAALGTGQTTRIFLPSSVMVDNPPSNLQEYSAAKLAAEMMGDILPNALPGVLVHAPRLPRMATDQTANVAAVQSADPGPLMLEELRRFLNLMPPAP